MIDWQPAVRPFGLFSFPVPERELPPIEGREPVLGWTDAEDRPVWIDSEGEYWAGPWYAEAEKIVAEQSQEGRPDA